MLVVHSIKATSHVVPSRVVMSHVRLQNQKESKNKDWEDTDGGITH